MQDNAETRKVRAQFLNGLAIASISSGILTPLATGCLNPTTSVCAVLISIALHSLALMLTSGDER